MKLQNLFVSLIGCFFIPVCGMERGLIPVNNVSVIGNRSMQPALATESQQLRDLREALARNRGPKYYVRGASGTRQELLDDWAEGQVRDARGCVEFVRNKIDTDLLGLDKNSWGRPFYGAYVSWRKALSLNGRGSLDELKRIEKYVPTDCLSHLVYQELFKRHWYFQDISIKATNYQYEELCRINGSTLDALIRESKETSSISRLLRMGIIKTMMEPHQCMQNFHVLGFSIPYSIDVNNLFTSTDGYYVKAMDKFNNVVIIDLENGGIVESCQKGMKWTKYNNNSFSITPIACSDLSDDMHRFALQYKPTIESFFCVKALSNSYDDAEELKEILKSLVLQNLPSFMRVGFRQEIDKRLLELK